MFNIAYFNISYPEAIFIFVEVALVAFWAWMLWDVPRSVHLTRSQRIMWLVGFAFAGAVAAILYFFIHYTNEGPEDHPKGGHQG